MIDVNWGLLVWLIDWLIDGLIDWWMDWLIDGLIDGWIDWWIDWFSWLIDWLMDGWMPWIDGLIQLVDWFDWLMEMDWLTDLIDGLIGWWIDWLMDWFVYGLMGWLIDWLISLYIFRVSNHQNQTQLWRRKKMSLSFLLRYRSYGQIHQTAPLLLITHFKIKTTLLLVLNLKLQKGMSLIPLMMISSLYLQ